MLCRRGLIDLTQDIRRGKKSQYLRDVRDAHLRVILNNGLRLHYDVRDSWEIDEEYLSEVDFYFKRGFSSSCLESLGKDRTKVHPFGLNYEVYPSGADKYALERSLMADNIRGKVGAMARSLCLLDSFQFTPRVHLMESLPVYDSPIKVLFMVRAWDPYSRPGGPKEKVEERECINRTRADCIRLLNNAFGSNCCAGFIHTDSAVRNYRALLLPDNRQSLKKNYLALLRAHSICVATTGLHGSIGWKFGEYVAFSKAILSETLNYEVPGNRPRKKLSVN